MSDTFIFKVLYFHWFEWCHIIFIADFTWEEYCPVDTFDAQCSDTEVILMTHARYGAMRMGKCIDMEIGKY